ncbi:MAG TPA: ATP-binding protein, partial [Armatimonadota bacterium]|nr:ATP-binding protein [Armatimonadota bacterium]
EQAYEAVKDAKLKVNIDTPKDVSLARHLIRELAVNNGMTGDRLESYILAVGEATVNAVKHGESGVVYSDISDGKIYTGVIDNGPGMDTFVLTRAALQQGFSTKPSLGLGYSFILSGSDYVMLATSKTGTAVVMWKSLEKAPEPSPIDLSRLPDAW